MTEADVNTISLPIHPHTSCLSISLRLLFHPDSFFPTKRAAASTLSGTKRDCRRRTVEGGLLFGRRERRWRLIAAPVVRLRWRLVLRLCLRPGNVSKKRSATTTYPFTIVSLAPCAPPAASAQRRVRRPLVSPATWGEYQIDVRRHPLALTFSLLGGRLDGGQWILCIVQTSGCRSFAHYSSFNMIYSPFQKATLPASVIGSRGASTCPDYGAQPFYFGERQSAQFDWYDNAAHINPPRVYPAPSNDIWQKKNNPEGQ